MTPRKAKKLLESNTANRTIRAAHVDALAREMQAGNWQLNGETIIVDEHGELLDGQHRLSAVVQSGCTVDMFVARGVATDTRSTIDQGISRTLADVLQISGGASYSTAIAAAFRQVDMYRRRGFFGERRMKMRANASEALAWYQDNPDIKEAIDLYKPSATNPKVGLVVWIVLHHLLPEKRYEEFNKFFNKVHFGLGLTEKCPAGVLREEMIERRRKGKSGCGVQEVTRMTAHYFNLFAAGKKIAKPVKLPEKIVLEG
jgi:hypothetical protein